MSGANKAPAFAPADPTDGRAPLDWQSKYDKNARDAIRTEAIYLGLLLFLVPTAILLLWLGLPKQWLALSDDRYKVFARYGTAWLAGTLGGVLFAIKWLYHTVARRIWHLDRRLWRLFTPHISGGLAFAMIALISSGLLSLFDSKASDSLRVIVGTSFLVGYFSDSAIAKLSEVAETLFGASRGKDLKAGSEGKQDHNVERGSPEH